MKGKISFYLSGSSRRYALTIPNGNDVMTKREFVRLVRAKLDADGHRDIAIERNWIDVDADGHPFLLRVPVGTELEVPLRPMEGLFEIGADDTDTQIGHYAKALVTLKRSEKTLVRYAGDVRRAANAEIATARAEGLDLLLKEVSFKPTRAYHLARADWKDAALHVLACVRVQHTSFNLRPTTSDLLVEEADDVAAEMLGLRVDQRERQAKLAEMELAGYDLMVDAITLDLLAAHGLDATEVLRDVWKRESLHLTVKLDVIDTRLSLMASDGVVTASIELENAYWNGEHLWFTDEALHTGHAEMAGKALGNLVSHPTFAARPITSVKPFGPKAERELIYFDISEKFYFDADTGRIWREERLAA